MEKRLTLDSKLETASAATAVTLPFGIHRRTLPSVLESLAMTFLEATSLSCLFLCSRSLSARVARHLETTKTLFLDAALLHDQFGLKLVARHCKHLEVVDSIPRDRRSFLDLADQGHAMIEKLLQRNQRTVQLFLPQERLLTACFETMTHCPRLMELHLDPFLARGALNPSIFARINSKDMPGLRKLYVHFGSEAEFKRVLEQGCMLSELSLPPVTGESLRLLAAPSLAQLNFLKLIIQHPSCSLSALTSLCTALAAMRDLQHLYLCFEGHRQLGEVTLRLPSMTTLEIEAESVVCGLPTFVAPSLTELHLWRLDGNLLDSVTASALSSPKLADMVLYVEESNYSSSCANKLLAALADGRWPALTDLTLALHKAAPDTLLETIFTPRSSLRKFKCTLPSYTALIGKALRQLPPSLEELDVSFTTPYCAVGASVTPSAQSGGKPCIAASLRKLSLDTCSGAWFSDIVFSSLESFSMDRFYDCSSLDLLFAACPKLAELRTTCSFAEIRKLLSGCSRQWPQLKRWLPGDRFTSSLRKQVLAVFPNVAFPKKKNAPA